MGLKPIPRIQLDDEKLNRFQDQIAKQSATLSKIPFLDGILLSKVSLVAGLNQVPHKLGREPQGYLVLRNRTVSIIYDNQDAATFDKKIYLNLGASAATTVDLWVF